LTALAHRAPAPLDAYLAEIARIPVLDREEEQRLATRYRHSREPWMAHALVRANLRFVVHLAREHWRSGFSMADLVQEGNLGLIEAVERFDPGRGVRLVTYASTWIRARILNHILGSWSLVRVATTAGQRRLFFSLARTRRDLERRLDPADPEAVAAVVPMLARCLGVSPAAVEEMRLRLDARDVSLDAPAPGGLPGLEAAAAGASSQEDLLAVAEEGALDHHRVHSALACLDERERLVIELRVLGEDVETLQAVGERLGCGGERARQIEVRARGKLRRCLLECGGTRCEATRLAAGRTGTPAAAGAPRYSPAST
jgi:RNA polymerase sigma-32 factor